jgi:hypothetical protein
MLYVSGMPVNHGLAIGSKQKIFIADYMHLLKLINNGKKYFVQGSGHRK